MDDRVSHHDLVIILAATLPSTLLLVLATAVCCRSRRRKARLFRRGITPIDDEEIHSWRVDRSGSEKLLEHQDGQVMQQGQESHHDHRPSVSMSSISKPASVIIYQNPSRNTSRMSQDHLLNPSSDSFELPPVPVLARAPNSRPGLTDESVQGEDPFISQPRRQTVRLSKAPPGPHRHVRSKSSRATIASAGDTWYGQDADFPSRRSADTYHPGSYSTQDFEYPYAPHWISHRTSANDELFMSGLSPRPLIRESDIGRAIG